MDTDSPTTGRTEAAMSDERWRIFDRVNQERVRQDARWGEQNHPDVDRVLTDRGPSEYRGMTSPGGCSPARMAEEYGVPTENRARAACDGAARIGQCTWAHIAVEEMAEVIHAATLAQQGKGPESAVDAELIQLAAVVTAWIEARARRGRTVTAPDALADLLDARRERDAIARRCEWLRAAHALAAQEHLFLRMPRPQASRTPRCIVPSSPATMRVVRRRGAVSRWQPVSRLGT